VLWLTEGRIISGSVGHPRHAGGAFRGEKDQKDEPTDIALRIEELNISGELWVSR
jgi:hypothetical protein